MKQVIRLTESDLHRMIKESVREVLREGKYVNNKPLLPGVTRSGHLYPNDWHREGADKYWQERGFENYADAQHAAFDPNDDRLSEKEYYDFISKIKKAII